MGTTNAGELGRRLMRRHLEVGWLAVFVFVLLGIGLEVLHGFKAGLYLNPSQGTRRLMWTLAHAHGTLLGLLNIAFGLTMERIRDEGLTKGKASSASACLLGATVLLPGGFFLGGFGVRGSDPGLGIVLAPVGAIFLAAAVFWAWRSARSLV